MGGRLLGDQGCGEPWAEAVEQPNRVGGVLDQAEADLGGIFPLPFAAELILRQGLDQGLVAIPLGAAHDGSGLPPDARQGVFVAAADVQLAPVAAPLAGPPEGVEEPGNEVVGPTPHDAADVQGVADLAVQRMEHGRGEALGIGRGVGDDPGPARAVQAHRRAALPRHCAQLRHRPARASRHG